MCQSLQQAQEARCSCFERARRAPLPSISGRSVLLAGVAALIIWRAVVLVTPAVAWAVDVALAIVKAAAWATVVGLVVAVGAHGMPALLARCRAGQLEAEPPEAVVAQRPGAVMLIREGVGEAPLPGGRRRGHAPRARRHRRARSELRRRRDALAAQVCKSSLRPIAPWVSSR
jgi:hypothetical protein